MSSCNTTTPASTAAPGDESRPLVMTTGQTFRFITRIKKSAANGGGPFSLTGWTGRSQMRKSADDVGAPIATLSVTNHATETGRADVTLSALLTTAIPVGKYVLDVEFEDDLDPTEVMPGTPGIRHVLVRAGVTK